MLLITITALLTCTALLGVYAVRVLRIGRVALGRALALPSLPLIATDHLAIAALFILAGGRLDRARRRGRAAPLVRQSHDVCALPGSSPPSP